MSQRNVLWLFAFLVNASLWWFVWQFPHGEAPLVLRYRIGGGIDLLGARATLRVIPAAGTVILVVNAMLAAVLQRRDPVLTSLLMATAFLAQLFLVIALVTLFAVNRA